MNDKRRRRRFSRRVFMIAALLVALTGAGAWWLLSARRSGSGHDLQESAAASAAAAAIRSGITADLVPAQYVQTARTLEATGAVRPELEAVISARVMGRIVEIAVREGDVVRRGQTLVRLDARDLDAAVEQAGANARAARVGRDNARVTARMETALSSARIRQAQARLSQAEAGYKSAIAQRDLVVSGPRQQEKTQAALAVAQTKTALDLAERNRDRFARLYESGAVAKIQADTYQSQYDAAKAQYESARQAQSIAEEGSRAEELRAAEQTVRQAQAEVNVARAGVAQAKAAALQADVRRQEIAGATAQIGQSEAARQIARVTRDYATLAAPFDGVVAARLADPGALAAPGTPLLRVQGGSLRLHAVVPESALSSASIGQRVAVQMDALGKQRRIAGRIREIAPQGDPSSHTFIVKIDLPPGSGAKAGMFGRARFVIGSERRMLVPESAVAEREGLRYVYVVDSEGVIRLRLVTVGEAHDGSIPVLSGLSEGEQVIASTTAAGGTTITDGMRIAMAATTQQQQQRRQQQ